MIAPQELLNYLKATPFRPFRIHMASGDSFDVRHPELVRVGRNSSILFTLVSESPDIFDRWETLSLMLMERISQLDATVPPTIRASCLRCEREPAGCFLLLAAPLAPAGFKSDAASVDTIDKVVINGL